MIDGAVIQRRTCALLHAPDFRKYYYPTVHLFDLICLIYFFLLLSPRDQNVKRFFFNAIANCVTRSEVQHGFWGISNSHREHEQ